MEARVRGDEIRLTARENAALKPEGSDYKSAGGGVIYDQRTGKPVYVKPPAPKGEVDVSKENEKRFNNIEKSAIKQAADMTKAKYGSTALNITTNSDGTVSFGSTGNEEADKFYEATKERLKTKGIKDAVNRKALPKDYDNSPAEPKPAAVPKPTGKVLDATTAAILLKKAGGDKEKARKLAKDAGYKF
jgi:hypothetical protein